MRNFRPSSIKAPRSAGFAPLLPAFVLLNQGYCLRPEDFVPAPGVPSRDVWSRIPGVEGNLRGDDGHVRTAPGRIYFASQHNRGEGSPIEARFAC
jgi:hypothetical protein